MQDSTTEDYTIILARHAEHLDGHADRVLDALRELGEGDAGYAVSRSSTRCSPPRVRTATDATPTTS